MMRCRYTKQQIVQFAFWNTNPLRKPREINPLLPQVSKNFCPNLRGLWGHGIWFSVAPHFCDLDAISFVMPVSNLTHSVENITKRRERNAPSSFLYDQLVERTHPWY